MPRLCDDCSKPLDGAPLPPEATWLCGACSMRETDAGDYYDRAAVRAKRLGELLLIEKTKEIRDGKRIKQLERQLEAARYTGD